MPKKDKFRKRSDYKMADSLRWLEGVALLSYLLSRLSRICRFPWGLHLREAKILQFRGLLALFHVRNCELH